MCKLNINYVVVVVLVCALMFLYPIYKFDAFKPKLSFNFLPNILYTKQNTYLSLDEDTLNALLNASVSEVVERRMQFEWNSCAMHNCFNYTKCPIDSPLTVFIYNYTDYTAKYQQLTSILTVFSKFSITTEPSKACVYIVLIFNDTLDTINNYLNSLQYWSNGENHLMINLFSEIRISVDQIPSQLNQSAIVQSSFSVDEFRSNYDIIVTDSGARLKCKNSVSVYPVKQKYLVSFQCDSLNSLNIKFIGKLVSLGKQNKEFGLNLNGKESDKSIDSESLFSLILPPLDSTLISHHIISQRLSQILNCRSIPVLIGGDYLRLPFDEVIHWSKAVIRLPVQRIDSLIYILKSFTEEDIVEMRLHGKMLYERYLLDEQSVIETVLSIMRTRLQISAKQFSETQSISIYNNTFQMTKRAINHTESEEFLGPIEKPHASPKYRRKLTQLLIGNYDLWNERKLNPFYSYPSTPFDPISSVDAIIYDTSNRYRPLHGLTNSYFSKSIGGNIPYEQFTIVIPTYKREDFLFYVLERYNGMPYLNKVVIIWNNVDSNPSSSMVWPNISAPIVVIRPKLNSLNNRFLPYDCIETDAIFSVDDDTNATKEEIVLAFRVWRQARDRIVGIPARVHRWDHSRNQYYYTYDMTCEYSMVLTGAAFFHKYYSYVYTHLMPKPIREFVDKYMNCEDIAMNFLVSHISRKPPIKVSSKFNVGFEKYFVANKGLSTTNGHMEERTHCMNLFHDIYGYMPLLYSQYRADSVLYNMNQKQHKCFQNL